MTGAGLVTDLVDQRAFDASMVALFQKANIMLRLSDRLRKSFQWVLRG